jgi:hypothetical protein
VYTVVSEPGDIAGIVILLLVLSWTVLRADRVGACVVLVLVVDVLNWTTPCALVLASGNRATFTVPLLKLLALRLMRDAPEPEKDDAVTDPGMTTFPALNVSVATTV